MHIAAVLTTLAEKAKEFSSANKGARLTGEASTGQGSTFQLNLSRF
jgi:hypothetical protein